MICTFFGHRDAPEAIGDKLKLLLTDLIENKNVDEFYVGNQGNFDHIIKNTLKTLKGEYPHIRCTVVLAYLSGKEEELDSVYPEGLESVPPKYAIVKRNKWMIEHSDYVVTYVKYNFGGAAQFKKLAEKKGKTVLNLAIGEQN